jgi:hypothetical protein
MRAIKIGFVLPKSNVVIRRAAGLQSCAATNWVRPAKMAPRGALHSKILPSLGYNILSREMPIAFGKGDR